MTMAWNVKTICELGFDFKVKKSWNLSCECNRKKSIWPITFYICDYNRTNAQTEFKWHYFLIIITVGVEFNHVTTTYLPFCGQEPCTNGTPEQAIEVACMLNLHRIHVDSTQIQAPLSAGHCQLVITTHVDATLVFAGIGATCCHRH